MEQDRPNEIYLSVVLPIFEEEATIQELIDELFSTLAGADLSFEVIAVDDGSKDETINVLQQLKNKYSESLVVVQHMDNRGNGATLRTGIRVAKGEIVVTMDADGQHAPADILKLIEKIPPYDLVIGARTESYAGSWYRNRANSFYNWFASWLTRKEIKDLTSGFRAMKRYAVQHFLSLFPAGFSAPTTTTMAFLKAGYNVDFVPIHVDQRTQGTSKIRLWSDGSRFIIIILRMIMLYDPMRIFMPTGIGLALLGVLAWGAGLWNAQRLVLPNSTILFFSSALLTWLLGLVSDQISNSRIHYHGDEHIAFLE
jgi:glycosyltransferase involved in cell wall biosynthesis